MNVSTDHSVSPDMTARARLIKPGPAITFAHIFDSANGDE
jgi:hypothetical protein